MKLVIDSNIPYTKGVLEPYARVEYIDGSRITRDDLMDADALIIRTRTKCREELLTGTSVKFIGSATIGTDHIDTVWCKNNGIECVSAPGCNSGSVMQYVITALVWLINKFRLDPAETTLGIVGVGNTGSRIASAAGALGFNLLLNDPPRSRNENTDIFVPINKLLDYSDIISLHVPLTYSGPDKTYQLAGENFFSRIKTDALLINTSRGQVVDENILLDKLERSEIRSAVLDVWRNEPDINPDLLEAVEIGTAHIAGYSVDGKSAGTKIIINKLAEFFDLPLKDWEPDNLPAPEFPHIDLSEFEGTDLDIITRAVLHTYPIIEDSSLLKDCPGMFENLRKNYSPRREFDSFTVKGGSGEVNKILSELGFKIS